MGGDIMTMHRQIKSFVDSYGADILKSPNLVAFMADERIFHMPENRPFKPLFRQMVAFDHVSQIVQQWNAGIPSASTYAGAYSNYDVKDLSYAVQCIGYALGKVEESAISNSGEDDQVTQNVGLEDELVEYIPHGSSDKIGTLIPAVMAEPVHRHLNEIAADEGSVIEFVRAEMCEPTADEIRKKISGEQIDGVALAMRQINAGRAFILGDMTGIGKGRQLAMLLKWAQRHGDKPVFVTEKAMLFNDLYRDLKDIGYDDMRPFILNNDSQARITDHLGNVVYGLPQPVEVEEFKNTGIIPTGYDLLLMTYSQVNKDSLKSWKPQAVLSAIKGNILIMDESHTASGVDSNVGTFFRQAVTEARGVCFSSATYAKYPSSMPIYALKTAMGDAKIPGADLFDIIATGGPVLQEVMAQGLVQSGSLVRRQRNMDEVERILDVPSDTNRVDTLYKSYDKVISLIDDIREFYRSYVLPFTDSIDPIAVLKADCKLRPREKWVEEECSIKGWNPQVRLAPTIRQLLFAIKTEQAIDRTLDEIRAGRKPIVQISRTMASNIARVLNIGDLCDNADFAKVLKTCVDDLFQYEAVGLAERRIGKTVSQNKYTVVKKFTFQDVLDYYNSKAWRISPRSSILHDTAKNASDCYDMLLANIGNALTGLPLSPIDYFIQRLKSEGLSVGELTQRDMQLVYDDVKAGPNSKVLCIARRPSDKRKTADEFNGGKIDVLIGNRVMASGISLHSCEAFTDLRPRTVITWEQQDSADLQTQFDGRADRTGQISRCKFIILSSPVPTEQRYLMINSRKQRSLNANVEANQGRDKVCDDIFNKYGARVIEEFIQDNPEYSGSFSESVHSTLRRRGSTSSKVFDNSASAQAVSYFMRDLGLMMCTDQQRILDDVICRYRELIRTLDETGENDLWAQVLPLQAGLTKRAVFVRGRQNSDSPFSADANLDELEVNVLHKPLKSAEIREQMSTLKCAKWLEPRINAVANEKLHNIEDYYTELRARATSQLAMLKSSGSYTPSRVKTLQERADNSVRMLAEKDNVILMRDELLAQLRYFQVGRSYSIPATIMTEGQIEDPVYAARIPVGIFMGYKVLSDKCTRSRIQAVFAVNDSRSIVRVPMSNKGGIQTIIRQSSLGVSISRNVMFNLTNWDNMIARSNRERIYMITGNILAGIAKCRSCLKNVNKSRLTRLVMAMASGKTVKFTDIHGNICTGYMLSRSFEPNIFFNNVKL